MTGADKHLPLGTLVDGVDDGLVGEMIVVGHANGGRYILVEPPFVTDQTVEIHVLHGSHVFFEDSKAAVELWEKEGSR